MFIQLNIVVTGQIHEQGVQIVQIVQKQVFDFVAHSVEINQQIGFIFCFRKFLCHIALAHTPCAINQKCRSSCTILLPADKLVVYLPLHRKPSNHENEIFIRSVYHENKIFTTATSHEIENFECMSLDERSVAMRNTLKSSFRQKGRVGKDCTAR